jgi:hypothetical protein
MDDQHRCKPSELQLRRCAERVLIALRLLRVSSDVTAAISTLEAPKEFTLSRTQSLWEVLELVREANKELASALSVALDYLEKNTTRRDQ